MDNDGNLYSSHKTLHPANLSWMLHIWFRRQRQIAETQYLHHHGVINITFTHLQPCVMRKRHVGRVLRAESDMPFDLSV